MRESMPWWDWPLEFSEHLLERMIERGLSEIDLREGLENAELVEPAGLPGRWKIVIAVARARWAVIVEPDEFERVLVLVTAYRL